MSSRRKVVSIILIMSFLLLLIPEVSAHPGGLDSNGCHTCKKKCESWGLSYGQYHCHNGKSTNTTSSSSSSSTTTVKKKSSNTNLKSIKINNSNIKISNNMSYETDKSIIKLDVKTSDLKSTATYEKLNYLEDRNTKIKILVTAEDKTKKEYTINVKLISSDSTLSSVKINGEETKIENYSIKYTTYEEDLDIEVIPSSEYATLEYNKKVHLEEGQNSYKINVKAENGKNTIYTLNITKETELTTMETIGVIVFIIVVFFIVFKVIKNNGKKQEESQKHCPKCKKKVEEDAKYCENCGTKI